MRQAGAALHGAGGAPRDPALRRRVSTPRMACGAASTVQVNGLSLQVYRWGRPELRPALLLHSLAGHSHWWDWVAPLLTEDFHVVAVDLRGHGGSDWIEPG